MGLAAPPFAWQASRMKPVVVAAVIAILAPAIARADDKACKPAGVAKLSIVRDAGDQRVSSTELFANGAWTYAEPAAPANHGAAAKPAVARAGCLDATTQKTVAADLAAMKWTISHPRIRCMAVSPNTTTYATGDRAHVFTKQLCGADELDVSSATKLAEIERLLAAAIAAG